MPRSLVPALTPLAVALALSGCAGAQAPATTNAVVSPVTLSNGTGTPTAATPEPATSPEATRSTPDEVGEPTECEQTVTENVVGTLVVEGVTCVGAVLVDGDILVRPGGALVLDDTSVEGGVRAEGHRSVVVIGGEVDGDIVLRDGGSARILGVFIDDDLRVVGNTGPQEFRDNIVDGNMICDGSAPAPTGGGNRVTGSRQGQCESL